ncbi:lipid kinase, YegS/Rv2252/BmrU family [Ruminococcus sp. YE71]|uniref:diacylglycerol/lipid kinase family protein n=1 Tax=unclassified Ruminococcus TaxID=2608920 RepID=UPI00088F8CAE|nr:MULTISPECIES: YegS/Rv2252/BmrU family lipid kinase [unclassified Ruminococcus]SDA14223.1 lipid kinase, YegS/Rv2252/BmrU family [Ruminococcus sp. YE78]SFW20735.1 lipid kinase, YegS/Rv2252/BmrU family [Ruminococcus sp. YE71]
MKTMLFIYNPRSGKGNIRYNLFEIINIFTSGGYQVTAYPTLNPRDCFKLITETGMNYDVVTVSGGDGTLSEAVHALMNLPEKIPLGYIPAGSTNDFASSMSIPKNMEQAARDIVNGVFFEYDIGKFNDRYFVYVAAFGMFTDVSYETSQDVKNLIGHAAYIVEGIRRLPNYRGIEMTVEHDGVTETGNFIVGLVSNSKSVAGMKFLLDDTVFFDDGLFEVSLVRTPANPLMLQQTLNDAIMNRLNTKNFLTFKTSKVTFTTAEPLAWTLDGEAGGAHTKMEITNCRRAIKLIIMPNDNTDQQREIDNMNDRRLKELEDN